MVLSTESFTTEPGSRLLGFVVEETNNLVAVVFGVNVVNAEEVVALAVDFIVVEVVEVEVVVDDVIDGVVKNVTAAEGGDLVIAVDVVLAVVVFIEMTSPPGCVWVMFTSVVSCFEFFLELRLSSCPSTFFLP